MRGGAAAARIPSVLRFAPAPRRFAPPWRDRIEDDKATGRQDDRKTPPGILRDEWGDFSSSRQLVVPSSLIVIFPSLW